MLCSRPPCSETHCWILGLSSSFVTGFKRFPGTFLSQTMIHDLHASYARCKKHVCQSVLVLHSQILRSYHSASAWSKTLLCPKLRHWANWGYCQTNWWRAVGGSMCCHANSQTLWWDQCGSSLHGSISAKWGYETLRNFYASSSCSMAKELQVRHGRSAGPSPNYQGSFCSVDRFNRTTDILIWDMRYMRYT